MRDAGDDGLVEGSDGEHGVAFGGEVLLGAGVLVDEHACWGDRGAAVVGAVSEWEDVAAWAGGTSIRTIGAEDEGA